MSSPTPTPAPASTGSVPSIGFVSLGCPKATVDSERILTRLRAEGYSIQPQASAADLVIVNTCGFIDAAVEESFSAIECAMMENGRVIVTGCLGARAGQVRAAFPDVLAVTGPQALDEVMMAVHAAAPAPHDPFTSLVPPQGVRLTPRHYAYLKIAEGCEHRCSFCIIPDLRGGLVSRGIGEILEEAWRLADAGVRELLVVAQDTAAYGRERRYRSDFFGTRPLRSDIATLARVLGELPAWIRLHYVYPYPEVDRLVELMAEEIVLPYLDLPLQHANARILRTMRRPAAGERMLARIARWRATCPQLVMRSTFIVGFPGETEAEFEELLAFLQAAELDRVGCFSYSPVTGAAANALPGAVPETLKEERRARLMETQATISRARLQRRIGERMTVLVDAVEDDRIVARSHADAPEIDGEVIVPGAWEIEPGDFIEVEITGAGEHDLWAEPVTD